MDIEPLVQKIEQEIERQLLTQAEVARLSKISRQRVNAILHRRSKSIPAIRAMVEGLGMIEKRKRPNAAR